MGFLHKLWDETLAGPPPETGLGKLRKHDSFPASRSTPMVKPNDDHQVPVTRSITILRTSSHLKNLSADSGSAPGSPSGSSTPGTPHSRCLCSYGVLARVQRGHQAWISGKIQRKNRQLRNYTELTQARPLMIGS